MTAPPYCSLKGAARVSFLILVFILFSGVLPCVQAAVSSSAPVIEAYYFYGDGCVHCANVKPFLDDLEIRHPEMVLRRFEVYHNSTNRDFLTRIAETYGIKSIGVPALFIGDRALIGDTQIKDSAEQRILELEGTGVPVRPKLTIVQTDGNCPTTAGDLTLPLVISCALIDSVNPCAFAVLVFLLLSLITLESRRRVLMVGGAYISAVFVFYLLSGLGLFVIVQGTGFSQILFIGAASLSVVLGLVNIMDVFRKKEGFLLAIPDSRKDLIAQYISKASLPAAFVLGILVGIFELPCTGGIYLAILSMMSKSLTFQAGLPYLLLYNFIFILPLIVILLVVSFGLSPERVNSWRLENRRILRLAIGVAMVAIGAVMLSGLI